MAIRRVLFAIRNPEARHQPGLAKAIQVAGTAEITQLPFFVAACDYTLLAEELFAASAYLSREPKILSTLKASDWAKVLVGTVIVVGAIAASFGSTAMKNWLNVQ